MSLSATLRPLVLYPLVFSPRGLVQAQGAPTPQEAREVAHEILSRSEYDREENFIQSALGDFKEWLFGLFGDLFSSVFGEASANWGVVMAVVATLILVVALVMILHLLLSGNGPRRSARAESLSEAARARAAELRLEARAAREAGDRLLALRLYFFALVVGLGERGDLHYRAGWTNRELLERGEPTPEVSGTLRPLVGELDAMSFGGLEVEEEDVDRFEALCDRWLEGAASS